MLETLRFIQMVQLLKNETSFRIYIVDNCNLSSIREEVSKKINACTFKPIQLQFRQKEAMVNSIKCLFSVKQTKWHLSNHRRQNSTRPPFFVLNGTIKPRKPNVWPPKISTLRLREYFGCALVTQGASYGCSRSRWMQL